MHATTSQRVAPCIAHLQINRQRIQYPTFRTMGLCVSSGGVEAGCKNTIGARLKRAGMHWSVDGHQCYHCLTMLHPQQPL